MAGENDAVRVCQDVGLYLLDALIEVCATHNVSFQLAGGTLLGALRHEGFIPWDDDVDVTMVREDFERLRSVAERAPEAFGADLELVVGADHIGRLVLTTSSSASGPLRLDIFPLDPVPAGAPQRLVLTVLFWWVKTAESVTWGEWRPTRRHHVAAAMIRPVARAIGRPRLQRWLGALAGTLARASDGSMCNLLVAHRPILRARPTAWYRQGRTATFERRQLPVPQAAEQVLAERYGPEWRMPPATPAAPHFPPPLFVTVGDLTAEVS